jgi:hypothetical protein
MVGDLIGSADELHPLEMLLPRERHVREDVGELAYSNVPITINDHRFQAHFRIPGI